MTWSIRARLTAWYMLVVVAVLAASMTAIALVQARPGVQRLDGELARLMITLEGVMKTEFNEGLSLQDAAKEASMEVVAPDRTLVLVRPDGSLLEMWGLPLLREWRPNLAEPRAEGTLIGSARVRISSRPITYGSQPMSRRSLLH